MALHIVGRVFKIQFPKFEKLVMLKLADWYNDDHESAWCYRSALCAYTSLSKATVDRVLKDLETQGILTIERNQGRLPNWYELDLDRAQEIHGLVKLEHKRKRLKKAPPSPGERPGDSASDRGAERRKRL